MIFNKIYQKKLIKKLGKIKIWYKCAFTVVELSNCHLTHFLIEYFDAFSENNIFIDGDDFPDE